MEIEFIIQRSLVVFDDLFPKKFIIVRFKIKILTNNHSLFLQLKRNMPRRNDETIGHITPHISSVFFQATKVFNFLFHPYKFGQRISKRTGTDSINFSFIIS